MIQVSEPLNGYPETPLDTAKPIATPTELPVAP
jgi:hypothetical protein